MRAPSGDYTNDTITAATKLNMKTIQWSVDSLDWKGLDTDEIVKRVTDKTECGSIILFHNDIKTRPTRSTEFSRILRKRLFVCYGKRAYIRRRLQNRFSRQANQKCRRKLNAPPYKNSIGNFIRKIRFYLSLSRIKNL